MRTFTRSTFTIAILLMVMLQTACFGTRVDSTEHCVETKYGAVINPKMSNGWNWQVMPGVDNTCFNLVEQNFPGGNEAEALEAATSDPVQIAAKVRVVYQHNGGDITGPKGLYTEKRTPERAEQEVINAVRSGFNTAMKSYTVARLFSPEGVNFEADVKAQIQARLGDQTTIKQVFITDLTPPEAIQQARIAAAQQAQILDKAQKQYAIDSVNARSSIVKAEAEARRTELEARALATSPEVLKLKAAEAMARGLANACGRATTCIIGGSVVDTWKFGQQ